MAVASFLGGVVGGLAGGDSLSDPTGRRNTTAALAIVIVSLGGGAACYSLLHEISDEEHGGPLAIVVSFLIRGVLLLIPFWLIVIPGFLIGWGLSRA